MLGLSDLRVEVVDPADAATVALAYDVFRRAETHLRPRADVMGEANFMVSVRTVTGSQPWRSWVARSGGDIVGVGLLTWPTTDNLHVCWGSVSVEPDLRRRRIGSALLSAQAEAARALARRTLEIEVAHPIGAGTAPGEAFLAASGLEQVHAEVRYELALPVGGKVLTALAERASTAYELRTWVDVCPPELSAMFREGLEAFDAPHGDREVEAPRWSEERLREAEQRRLSAGRTSWTTAAFASDRSCAGYSALFVPADESVARQGESFVLAAHRGHRLGAGLKVANLRALDSERPDVATVSTYVDPDNAFMRSVNDALGFEPVETLTEWALVISA